MWCAETNVNNIKQLKFPYFPYWGGFWFAVNAVLQCQHVVFHSFFLSFSSFVSIDNLHGTNVLDWKLKNEDREKKNIPANPIHLTVTIMLLIHLNFPFTHSITHSNWFQSVDARLFWHEYHSAFCVRMFVCDAWLIATKKVLTCWFVEKCFNSFLLSFLHWLFGYHQPNEYELFRNERKMWLTTLIDLTSSQTRSQLQTNNRFYSHVICLLDLLSFCLCLLLLDCFVLLFIGQKQVDFNRFGFCACVLPLSLSLDSIKNRFNHSWRKQKMKINFLKNESMLPL